jgi:hypothetical protein
MGYLIVEVEDKFDHEVVSIGPFPDEQKARAVMDACQWGHADRVRVSADPVGSVISIGVAFRTILLTKPGQPVCSRENFRYVSSLIMQSHGGP